MNYIGLVFVGVVSAACGAVDVASTHIFGGHPVNHLDRAYSVRLKFFELLTMSVRFCGGVRLDQHWFITAAECFDKDKFTHMQIAYPAKLPHFDWDYDDYDFRDLQYVIHPKYDNVTKENNIAVFPCKFCLPVPDNESLPLLPKISEPDQSFSSWPAEVSRWTINNHTTSNQIENKITSFDTRIVNPFLCKIVYFFRSVLNQHICVSAWGGKRISEAHVGVPLIVKEGSRVKLVGIASSIKPWTTKIPIPNIFTKISPYVDWISEQTGIKIRQ